VTSPVAPATSQDLHHARTSIRGVRIHRQPTRHRTSLRLAPCTWPPRRTWSDTSEDIMRTNTFATLAALAALLAACGDSSTPPPSASSDRPVTPPSSARPPTKIAVIAGAAKTRDSTQPAASSLPIEYNGGYVMGGQTHIYLVWYGDWSNGAETTIPPDFMQSIGGSPYFDINTTYDDQHGRTVANDVTLAGQIDDAYSHGAALGDGDVGDIVAQAIDAGQLPLDVHGVYFVLTSADVTEGSFCSGYCGYHSYELVGDVYVKYAFVGSPDQCPSGCEAQSIGPNGSASADGMASIMAHELEETVTDPYADAWYDANGDENGDKCAWTFGPQYTTANGASANVHLGDRDYLIQQNWVNDASGGGCALSH
jgi:hypothetical protein